LRSEEDDDDDEDDDEDMTPFFEQEFDPKKIEDFDVIDVDMCTVANLERELKELQLNQKLTNSDVKVVFVVLKEEDFLHGTCQEELDKLQATLEDLNCGKVEDFEDFITIGVDSSSECNAKEMKDAVLEENAELKE